MVGSIGPEEAAARCGEDRAGHHVVLQVLPDPRVVRDDGDAHVDQVMGRTDTRQTPPTESSP